MYPHLVVVAFLCLPARYLKQLTISQQPTSPASFCGTTPEAWALPKPFHQLCQTTDLPWQRQEKTSILGLAVMHFP